MKSKLLLFLLLLSCNLIAQEELLPVGFSKEEKAMLEWERFTEPAQTRGISEPPPYPVRHMAEWEEIQALAITWRTSPSYMPGLLAQIAKHASEEVLVIIFCNNQSTMNQAQTTLQSNGVNLDMIQFSLTPNNSVWIRDYGPNSVYANDVEDLYFIDWIYNRPSRPLDDALPDGAGDLLGIPVYATTEAPTDLVHTGGNFMSDGMGTAFASKLTLEENGPFNSFNAGPHSPEDIDNILNSYMGIDRFIKMETLPYDLIHHIDMHMKLLDEETLLVGQYPEGVADGPQIEANLQYVLANYMSSFGTPYKVVRIVQPPDASDDYPNQNGDYRTYTNSVLVNKTILVPTYEEQYDTTALRIYRENYPGYKVFGIDCNNIIPLSGALHCITKEIGVNDPLLIQHQRLSSITDNDGQGDYQVSATIKHRTGIANAQVYFTTDTLAGYDFVHLTLADPTTDTWTGAIPHQENGSEIFYYIQAQANSAKTQVRPLAAPAGYYRFTVDAPAVNAIEQQAVTLENIYPNPASAITVVPVYSTRTAPAKIEVTDILGRVVQVIFDGNLPAGPSNYFLHADQLAPGTYFVSMKTEGEILTQRLVVK